MSNLTANYWDWPHAAVIRSDGPHRVVVDQPAPQGWQPPRLLGFTTPPTAPSPEPQLWEGDQA